MTVTRFEGLFYIRNADTKSSEMNFNIAEVYQTGYFRCIIFKKII